MISAVTSFGVHPNMQRENNDKYHLKNFSKREQNIEQRRRFRHHHFSFTECQY